MTVLVLTSPSNDAKDENTAEQHMEVVVHIQAEVLNPAVARRKANYWLAMNAGHLLLAENPELLLTDALQWRFDVFLSKPCLEEPGSVSRMQIGRLRLDAVTGEVADSDRLAEEFIAHADAFAGH